MDSCFNKILYDDSLSDSEIVRLLRDQKTQSEQAKEDIKQGNFDSDVFIVDKRISYQQCRNDYQNTIWNKLEEKSKIDLQNGYFFAALKPAINDDESTPIIKLAKTVEQEMKIKLFKGFSDVIILNRQPQNDDRTDCIVNKFLDEYNSARKVTLTLGQMLNIIKKSSSYTTPSNYARELKKYISTNNWNPVLFYSKRDKNYFVDYPSKYRNDSAHEYVFDEKLTNDCKKDTAEILTWFLGSYC